MTGDWGAVNRVPAVVTLGHGEVVPGYVHTFGAVPHRAGPETPLEMLNRGEQFFPLTFDDGRVLYLSKAQVAMLVYHPGAPAVDGFEVDGEAVSVGITFRVELILATGEPFQGLVRPHLRISKPRALDCVNSITPFFLLESEGGHHCINHAHVRTVRPLE